MTDLAFSDRAALADLLAFYAEAGVDIALADAPVDRFAAVRAETEARAARAAEAAREILLPPERPRPVAVPQPVARPGAAAVPGEAVADDARAAAAGAGTLDGLRAILETFEGCNLRQTARRLVFEDGNRRARLMFVGEAPGRDEDEQGKPFVGRSGQLLDRMLAAIGLSREDCYIANVVPWRPPGNRTPTPQEIEICRPFILRQIELVTPDILVFLGGSSAAALAGTKEGILKLRGRWLTATVAGRPIRSIATLHPAYLLRQPLQKRLAWRDFRAIRAAFTELSTV